MKQKAIFYHAGCGVCVAPDDVDGAVARVRDLAEKSSAELTEMGRAGWALVDREFSRNDHADRLLRLLEVAAGD